MSELVGSSHASTCRRFLGKNVIITGCARGIGLAAAKRLVAEGASVLMADRDEQIAGAANALAQPHIVIDLLAPGAVDELFRFSDQVFGELDVLVNNAGMTASNDFLELSAEQFDRIMSLNARVPLLASQAAARRMIKQGRGGVIVNVTSVSGTLGLPDQVPYCMSKGALRQLTTSTAVALAEFGIRVVAVGPGTVETDLVRQVMNDELRATVLSRTPLGRLADPAEIAAAIAFLASDDASYVTGQTLYVEGGRLSLNMVRRPLRNETAGQGQ